MTHNIKSVTRICVDGGSYLLPGLDLLLTVYSRNVVVTSSFRRDNRRFCYQQRPLCAAPLCVICRHQVNIWYMSFPCASETGQGSKSDTMVKSDLGVDSQRSEEWVGGVHVVFAMRVNCVRFSFCSLARLDSTLRMIRSTTVHDCPSGASHINSETEWLK